MKRKALNHGEFKFRLIIITILTMAIAILMWMVNWNKPDAL